MSLYSTHIWHLQEESVGNGPSDWHPGFRMLYLLVFEAGTTKLWLKYSKPYQEAEEGSFFNIVLGLKPVFKCFSSLSVFLSIRKIIQAIQQLM